MSIQLFRRSENDERPIRHIENGVFVLMQYNFSMADIYIKADQAIYVRKIGHQGRGKPVTPENGCISILNLIKAAQPYREELDTHAGYIGSFNLELKIKGADWQLFSLKVKAGSLDESDLNGMLSEIRGLAASEKSVLESQLTFKQVDTSDPQSADFNRAFGLSKSDLASDNTVDIKKCAEIMIENFSIIKQRSLKEMERNLQLSARHIAIKTPSGLKNYIKNPSKPKILHRKTHESLDCSENQFILWLLAYCIDQLKDDPIYNELLRIRKDDFFSKITPVKMMPKASYRLMNTQGYAQIYAVFYQQKNNFLQKLNYGIKSNNTDTIQHEYGMEKTWKCYEIWCLLKLYKMLKSSGFSVDKDCGRGSFFELLEIKDGEFFANKKGENSTLDKNFIELKNKDKNIKIQLHYEPQSYWESEKNQGYKPDFSIVIESKLKKYYFIFDAKYRSYRNQPEKFNEDIQTVIKYFNGFKLPSIQAKNNVFSCIFHSDKNREYCFSGVGEGLLKKNHSIGIVPLLPSNAEHMLNALKLLIFGHHLHKIDTCFECGEPFQHIPEGINWTTHHGAAHPEHQKQIQQWLAIRYLPIPFDFKCKNVDCNSHYHVKTCDQDPTHWLYTNMRSDAIQLHGKHTQQQDCPHCH